MVAILLGFHIGFVAQRNLQQVVILDGKWVAKYYYKESTLTIDLMSSLIYIAQVCPSWCPDCCRGHPWSLFP